MRPNPSQTTLLIPHGLGDVANIAAVLALYEAHGIRFNTACQIPGAELLLAGVSDIVPWEAQRLWDGVKLPWHERTRDLSTGDIAGEPWSYNKAAINVGRRPLPDIGSAQELWPELCAVDVPPPTVPGLARQWAAELLADMPRPVTLLHTTGYSYRDWKSVPDQDVPRLAGAIAALTGGAVVLLDHYGKFGATFTVDIRKPRFSTPRPTVAQLLALIEACDLVVGIDSGPLHASRLFETPSIGLWADDYIFPSRFSLPSARRINIVPQARPPWTAQLGPEWRIAVTPRAFQRFDPQFIAETCAQVLACA